jgi:1-deoxy-D-xylulose-5-phosphate reductoisomerase
MSKCKQKSLVLLGATGSVGQSTLEVLRAYPKRFCLLAIAGHQNIGKLAAIAHEFRVPYVGVTDEEAAKEGIRQGLFPKATKVLMGPDALEQLAILPEAEQVIVATTGLHSLKATFLAIEHRKAIAIANKETLVVAGQWVMERAKAFNVPILPIDSEHSAIFQCLEGQHKRTTSELILTASGGPFRNFTREQLEEVSPEAALQHPTWQMGPKVTIDSATLANKGLEVIEAHWFFGQPYDKIRVLVHPQSMVHSMVSFVDGSVLAQISPTKMTFPIQYSLFYPRRLPSVSKPLDWTRMQDWHFEVPDTKRFPCLKLAFQAGLAGGAYPIVFNAVNEVAVSAFLSHKIKFMQIPQWIENALAKTWPMVGHLEDALAVDQEARVWCEAQFHRSL